MQATQQAATEVDYRVYITELQQSLHDVRGPRFETLHDATQTSASVAFAREHREAGSWGLLYWSVRHRGAECVAVFRPQALALPARQGPHITLIWNGKDITGWYQKSDHQTLT